MLFWGNIEVDLREELMVGIINIYLCPIAQSRIVYYQRPDCPCHGHCLCAGSSENEAAGGGVGAITLGPVIGDSAGPVGGDVSLQIKGYIRFYEAYDGRNEGIH